MYFVLKLIFFVETTNWTVFPKSRFLSHCHQLLQLSFYNILCSMLSTDTCLFFVVNYTLCIMMNDTTCLKIKP